VYNKGSKSPKASASFNKGKFIVTDPSASSSQIGASVKTPIDTGENSIKNEAVSKQFSV